jgi:hypothetical protein
MMNNDYRCVNPTPTVIERLTELEYKLNLVDIDLITLKDLIDDLVDEQRDRIRIPHRCPVCNASAGVLPCNVCDDTGIVWG